MMIAVDFDGTIVPRMSPPLRLIPGVKEALLSLRAANHTLLLYSARANRSVRFNPELDPLVQAGVRSAPRDDQERLRQTEAHRRLYQEMVDFVNRELPGVFDAIDDGAQGKPLCDLFIDDKNVNPTGGSLLVPGWVQIAKTYGAASPLVSRPSTR